MKIFFVLGGLRIGGYEILTVNIANALSAKGFPVCIVSLSADNKLIGKIDEHIKLYFLNRKSRFAIKPLLKFREIITNEQPDIILCSDYIEFLYPKFACLGLKKQPAFLIAFHMTKPATPKDASWNARYAKMNKIFHNQHIAIHRSQIDFYCEHCKLDKNSFHLIYNGIDTDYFFNNNRKKLIADGKLHLINIASLQALKDHWTLLNAMVELNSVITNWELTIAGADVAGLQHSYEQFLQDNHIAEKVTFLGAVSDVKSLLENADLFLLTSITEALSVATIEAISMGVPAIVTNVGGNPEIISDGVEGFLVNVGDANAIAQKIIYLYQNQHQLENMQIKARQKAVACFGFDRMIDNYLQLFRKVCKNNADI